MTFSIIIDNQPLNFKAAIAKNIRNICAHTTTPRAVHIIVKQEKKNGILFHHMNGIQIS
jgi:hypothetical protein